MKINNKLNFQLVRLWNHITLKRKKQLVFLFILMVCSSFAELFSIGAIIPFLAVLTTPESLYQHHLIKPLLIFFEISNQNKLVSFITFLFIITIVFSAILRFFLLWFQTKLSFAIGADLSFNIYQKTLNQKYSVHLNRNSSEIIGVISNKVSYVIYQIITPLLITMSSILLIIIIFVGLISLNPKIFIFSIFIFIFIYAIIINISKSRLKVSSQKVSYETNEVIKILQEGLGGIRDILIDNTQEVYCEIYKKSDLSLRNAQATISIISGAPRYLIEALGVSLIALLAYSISNQSVNGISNAIPIIGAWAMGAQRILPILQQTFVNWASIRGGESSLVDILDLLDQPMPNNLNNENKLTFNQEIKLKNLSFSYKANGNLVLNNINLTIPKGTCYGIIGTTGGGKSTLLDILMGLLIPISGEIQIDGVRITESNYRLWQNHISHVPQSIYLSDKTILENIAFGVPISLIDQKRVIFAAEKAQISETIEKLEKKYNTIVGERGVFLSGGQRQRIGIARAIYKNSDVIIFDEATSALDNDTEKEVMNSIENLGKNVTVIIVAHRLTTLKKCDKIIEIKNNEINILGTYNEIISKS